MKHIMPAACHFIIHNLKQIARVVKAKYDVFVLVHFNRAFIPGVLKHIKDLLQRNAMFKSGWFADNLVLHTSILAQNGGQSNNFVCPRPD